jgi:hypothetical protein
MENEVKIPKFRNTTRLVAWTNKHRRWSKERLPRNIENIFFTVKKESSELVASNLTHYAMTINKKMENEFEELLKCNHGAIVNYCIMVHRNEFPVNESLIDELKGDNAYLLSWATATDSRLPKHLEDSLTCPRICYRYALEVLRGRLPEHLEDVFFGNATYAAKYAFDVIRGFASVKLPEALHSFMVMQNAANPNDDDIKTYIEASESDPNKIGNSTECV